MTNEEKQLLLKVLCGMLPYGVKIKVTVTLENLHSGDEVVLLGCTPLSEYPMFNTYGGKLFCGEFKPYLRPMSSMTDEEEKQLNNILPCSMSFSYTTKEELIIYTDSEYDGDHYFTCFVEIQDWLNKHHFDYRGLIEKGLALEASEDMYKNK